MRKRRKNDFYPSQAWAVEQLLAHAPVSGNVLEPCSGENDIVNVLRQHSNIRNVITNDVDETRPAETHLDAANRELYDGTAEHVDWIVTNPPFSKGFPILHQAYTHAREGVAFLLRLSFIEPTLERGPWLAMNPPTTTIVLPRYSFTRDGKTDSVTCAWFVWNKYSDTQRLIIVPREEKK